MKKIEFLTARLGDRPPVITQGVPFEAMGFRFVAVNEWGAWNCYEFTSGYYIGPKLVGRGRKSTMRELVTAVQRGLLDPARLAHLIMKIEAVEVLNG